MLVFSVLLLATSAFAAPGVLLDGQPQGDHVVYQQHANYNQTHHYVGQAPGSGVVPVNTQVQQPHQSYSPDNFQNQPGHYNGPAASGVTVDNNVHNVVPNSPVSQVPVQGVFGRSNNQQYNVVPQSHIVDPGFGVVPHRQVVVQPKHHVAGHEVVPQSHDIIDPGFGIVPNRQVVVQPKHHVAGHEGFVGVAKEHVSNDPAVNAQILQQDMDVSPDGSFHNVWSSDNGINVQEEGTVKHVGDTGVAVEQGVISYVDNEGNKFELKYVADENGFHAEGPHIPTPPPIPAAIVRSLQFIAEHPSTTEASTAQNGNYQPGQQQPVVFDH